jgi:hypothetical protein
MSLIDVKPNGSMNDGSMRRNQSPIGAGGPPLADANGDEDGDVVADDADVGAGAEPVGVGAGEQPWTVMIARTTIRRRGSSET